MVDTEQEALRKCQLILQRFQGNNFEVVDELYIGIASGKFLVPL